MSYKITEEGNVSTVHLDGEIDMDVTETAKEASRKLQDARSPDTPAELSKYSAADLKGSAHAADPVYRITSVRRHPLNNNCVCIRCLCFFFCK